MPVQVVGPRLPITSVQFDYKSEITMTPSSILINLPEWLIEFRETLMLTSLLEGVIKDTDKQLDEEII